MSTRQVRGSLALAPAARRRAFRLLSNWWVWVENRLCVGEIQRQKARGHANGASHRGWGYFLEVNDPPHWELPTLTLPHPPFLLFPLVSSPVWAPRAPSPWTSPHQLAAPTSPFSCCFFASALHSPIESPGFKDLLDSGPPSACS